MESDNKKQSPNDNNLIIVRRDTGYFPFLWYVVLLRRMTMTTNQPQSSGANTAAVMTLAWAGSTARHW